MILKFLAVVFVARFIVGCFGCGGIFRQSHGSLRSPITGTKIGEITLCDYVLLAPNGHRIKVVFVDLVLKTSCCSCTNDFIELRDGDSDNSTLIGRYCAQNIPKIVYSTENKLWIRFKTDYKTSSENRFKLTFDTPCGHHYSALHGDFSSVGFPEPYPPNTECLYTIAVPRGRLKVSFESFDIEARSANCEFDFLEVKEILYVEFNSRTLVSRTRRYCGSETPPTIYSTIGSFLWFRFKTDSNGQRSGFRAKYRTISVGEGSCNKKLTSPKGLIYSKNYPFPFPPNTECYWEIEVQAGKFVHLSFGTFNFSRGSDSCKYGYLRVYDGPGFESQIGQYCGPRLPRNIVSRKNTMSLRLVSSNIYIHTGWFSVQYSTSNQGPCGAKKFTCQNHECIQNSKHCDGLKHCRDGSDEVGCPPIEDTPTWYSFWPVTVVIVMLFMGIWLWRTWRKFMTPRSDIQVSYCASPCHHHSNGAVSEVMEPPSYHEAISQPVHNSPPPTYEEAINSQPAPYIETVTNEERHQDEVSIHNNILAGQSTSTSTVNETVSNSPSRSPPSTRNSQSVDELGQPYTSHRPLDRTSEV